MKRVALINDLSGLGKCSLVAAIPVISVMGMQACPLPTAILTAQTGFDDYYCDDYTDRMDEFTCRWKKMGMTFDGIYSGYLAAAEQIDKVESFLDQFQTKENLFLADPVLGDDGEVFKVFSPGLLEGMRRLTLRADVITPNLTELCLLLGEDYSQLIRHRGSRDYLKRIEELAARQQERSKRAQSVIVTGILRPEEGTMRMGNLALSEAGVAYVEKEYTGKSFSGTGDLFASVVCGSLVQGQSVSKAVKRAASFLQEAILDATQKGIPGPHGVEFERYLHLLREEEE